MKHQLINHPIHIEPPYQQNLYNPEHETSSLLSFNKYEIPSPQSLKSYHSLTPIYTPKISSPPSFTSFTPSSKNQQITIPWKNRIITPTHLQLKEFKGNLTDIFNSLGSRSPIGKEKFYKQILIPWRGKILKPEPSQLLQTQGDLDKLTEILNQNINKNNESNSFRQGAYYQGPQYSTRKYSH